MKITRYTAIATAILLSCIGTFAQDFDDFGDFGDIGGGTSGGASSAVSISRSTDALKFRFVIEYSFSFHQYIIRRPGFQQLQKIMKTFSFLWNYA